MTRMLIVDDDEVSATLYKRHLQRELPDGDTVQIDTVKTVEEGIPLVKDISRRLDIVMADNELGPGQQGLVWLEEIRRDYPDIDCILFTEPSESVADRAAEAGIYRYLTQPVEPKELVWCVRSLIQHRSTDFKWQWLEKLNQVGSNLQQARTMSEVGDVIVQGGHTLGFGRVEMWRVQQGKREPIFFVGYKQAGKLVPRFDGFAMPYSRSQHVKQAYDEQEIKIFEGWEGGAGYVSRKLRIDHSPPAKKEWICLPLISKGRCTAVVTLQDPKHPTLREEEKELFNLFAQKISGAWERALTNEQQLFEEHVNQIVHNVTRQTILNGEPEDLGKLLQVLYDQINQITSTQNFVVALRHHKHELDKKGWLRYAFHLCDGVLREPFWRSPKDQGLIRDFINQNHGPCFCPVGTKRERLRRNVRPPDRIAKGWIATPLVVGQDTIGGVFIEEFDQQNIWSRLEAKLASAVIQRLSPLIQSAWIIEQRTRMARQRDLLQSANEKIMTLAQEQPSSFGIDEWVWHATLTLATAHYGFAFNRAMLFLVDERTHDFVGRMGIGDLDPEIAKHKWEASDGQHIHCFDDYITQLRALQIEKTPVYAETQKMRFMMGNTQSAFEQVLTSRERVDIPKTACDQSLPEEFITVFGRHDYWLLPAKAGETIVGVIVLDTFCETDPPQIHSLKYIDTLTNEAAIISQNMKYRRAQEQLTTLTDATLAIETDQKLLDILKRIVHTAHFILRADSVAIYPLIPNAIPLQFDHDQIAWYETGDLPAPDFPKELSPFMEYVLNYGDALVVPSVYEIYDKLRFIDDPVVQKKGMKSFIAIPIRGRRTGALRGILYINYHRQHEITEAEVRFARGVANITAQALRNWREQSGLHFEKEASEEQLRILLEILTHAMRPDVDETSIIDMILKQTRAFLYSDGSIKGELSLALFLRGWERDKAGEPREISRQYYISPKGITSYKEHEQIRGLTEQVMRTGKTNRATDVSQEPNYVPLSEGIQSEFPSRQTRSELDVPVIDEEGYPIGVINLESSELGFFTKAHKKLLARLSRVAMIALDTVQRRQFAASLFEAAKAITLPTEIDITLDNIIRQARHLLPDLSLLTIWRVEQRTNKLVLAVHNGLLDVSAQQHEKPREDGAIDFVIHATEPLWVEDVAAHPTFSGSVFILREQVNSTVAFPLLVDNKPLGAIFFSYRHHHRFSKLEREMLPILAMFVAIGIHDAEVIEAQKRERQRAEAALSVMTAVGETPELTPIFANARNILQELYHHATIVILQYDRERKHLDFVQDEDHSVEIDNPDYQGKDYLDLQEPAMVCDLAKKSLQTSEQHTLLLSDLSEPQSQPYLHLRDSAHTSIGATIMDTSGGLLGALVLEGDEPGIYREEDRLLVAAIATQIGVAIDRSNQIAAIDFRNVLTDSMIWAADLAHVLNREIYQMRTWLSVLREEATVSELGNEAVLELTDSLNQIAAEAPWSEQQPTMIEDLAQTLWGWVIEYLGEHNDSVTVQFEVTPQPVGIYAKSGVLKRIVRHLVSNALRAMNYAGTLTVWVETNNDECEIILQFGDSGPGIVMDDPLRESLFAQRIVDGRTKGGLGLLSVRLMAEQLGGHIHLLDYEEEHGACFCIHLPYQMDDEQVEESEPDGEWVI